MHSRLIRLILVQARVFLFQQTVDFFDQLGKLRGVLLGRGLFAKLLPEFLCFALHETLPAKSRLTTTLYSKR
jgi:hypothetical protein